MIKEVFDPLQHKTYTPKNPEKYVGKYPIILRSGLEAKFVYWCDNNPNVKFWSSESIEIPYPDPYGKTYKSGKLKVRRYYPDFLIQTSGGRFLVEVKPYKETIVPKKTARKSDKTYLQEIFKYKKNIAKWNAAYKFCKKHGLMFKIITEKDLS